MPERAYSLRVPAIEKLAKDKGLSLSRLANLSDVHIKTLGRWMKGGRASISAIKRLADQLGTTTSYLIITEDSNNIISQKDILELISDFKYVLEQINQAKLVVEGHLALMQNYARREDRREEQFQQQMNDPEHLVRHRTVCDVFEHSVCSLFGRAMERNEAYRVNTFTIPHDGAHLLYFCFDQHIKDLIDHLVCSQEITENCYFLYFLDQLPSIHMVAQIEKLLGEGSYAGGIDLEKFRRETGSGVYSPSINRPDFNNVRSTGLR